MLAWITESVKELNSDTSCCMAASAVLSLGRDWRRDEKRCLIWSLSAFVLSLSCEPVAVRSLTVMLPFSRINCPARLPSTIRRAKTGFAMLPLNMAVPLATATESIFYPVSKFKRNAVFPFNYAGSWAVKVYESLAAVAEHADIAAPSAMVNNLPFI